MTTVNSTVGGWYTLTDSSERLGVAVNTFSRWIARGQIEPPEKRGRRGAWLYNEQQLERIAARVHQAGQKARLQDADRCTLGETARRMGIDKETLLIWRRLGLIPQPDQVNRNGTLCTYSAEVVERLVSQVAEIRERQEVARRQKQGQSLKNSSRPPAGRYSLSEIARSANVSTNSIWRYRKLGLIPEPDQDSPGGPRSYSEQGKSEILRKIPKIRERNQVKAMLAMRAAWQNPESRKAILEKVKIGNSDPDVRRKRSVSARNAMSEEQRKAAGERSRRRWARIKEQLSTKPKRRGKPKGTLSPDTPARVTIIAACRLKGITPYQIAPHAYPLQIRKENAWKALEQFLERHSLSIAQRELELSKLSDSEYRTVVEAAKAVLRSQ